MSVTLLVAALLMFITAGIHVFAGGPEIMTPIRKSDLSKPVKAVSDVIWHAITVILLVMAVGLAWLAFAPNLPLLWMICALQIGFAGLFIVYGIRQLGNLRQMPQWLVFLGIPALSLWAVYG